MKTFFRLCLLPLLTLVLLAAPATAQTRAAVPTAGYWNLETNLTTRNYTMVRFYDSHDQLVYEERLDNLCLDLSRRTGLCRRTARQLTLALKQVLRDPAAVARTTALLSERFGQNRRVQRVYAVR